jgi:flagellar hook-basal body complex protein FliE
MSDMSVNQVLAQIRALSQQVRPPAGGSAGSGFAAAMRSLAPAAGPGAVSGGAAAAGAADAVGAAGAATGPSALANVLKRGLEQVNQTQQQASDLATQFQRGTPGVDLPQVMIEMQKATVSFRALTEVRNRLVSAYQEIMNMQM